MKPIIIKVTPNNKGKIEFTEEELRDIIDQAYEAGKSDASYPFITSPSTTAPPVFTTPWYTTVTCNSALEEEKDKTSKEGYF